MKERQGPGPNLDVEHDTIPAVDHRNQCGQGPRRYVARAVSPDGCSREFSMRELSEEGVRRRLEKFLKRHWQGYRVAELQPERIDNRRKGRT